MISGRQVPCDSSATGRALAQAFGPGVFGPGHTINVGHLEGREIIYWYDEMEIILGGFTPVSEWPGPPDAEDIPEDGVVLPSHTEAADGTNEMSLEEVEAEIIRLEGERSRILDKLEAKHGDNHTYAEYVLRAQAEYHCEGECEIDEHARVSISERGAYVQAWVWVENQADED